jgi:hypothetical protein
MSEKMETNATVIKAADVEPTLDVLAGIIRAEIQNCRMALCNALHHAMNAGDALIAAEAKIAVNGVNKKKWLQENCSVSVRTAFLYIQLAKHRDEIEVAILFDPELSLRAARRLISRPKRTTNDAEDGGMSAAEEESLFDHWLRLTPEVLAAELDRIGVDRVLGAMSPAFGQELRDRVPAKMKPATGKARSKTSERTDVRVVHDVFGRGVGFAGPPGQRFPTINMAQNGNDADGNPNYGQAPADRSRAN